MGAYCTNKTVDNVLMVQMEGPQLLQLTTVYQFVTADVNIVIDYL